MHLTEKIYLKLHNSNLNRRLQRQVKFEKQYVVSVGNLSVGGTGKTPVGLYLAHKAIQKRFRTAVVLRGYKARLSRQGASVNALADSQDKAPTTTAADVGDEALIYTQQKDLQVVIGKNRADVIQKYCLSADFVILDDAFQNPSVYRNFDLVLIDSTRDVAQLRLLPVGRYREPLAALERAHCVLLTRSSQSTAGLKQNWIDAIQSINPMLPVFECDHQFLHLRSAFDNQIINREELKKDDPILGVFSGIAHPKSFHQTVRDKLGSFKLEHVFADHYLPTIKELRQLLLQNENAIWITTQKDFVRIRHLLPGSPELAQRIYYLEIGVQIDQEREFLNLIPPLAFV